MTEQFIAGAIAGMMCAALPAAITGLVTWRGQRAIAKADRERSLDARATTLADEEAKLRAFLIESLEPLRTEMQHQAQDYERRLAELHAALAESERKHEECRKDRERLHATVEDLSRQIAELRPQP